MENPQRPHPHPIDNVVGSLIEGAAQNGRSWLLDAVRDNDGKVKIEFAHVLPPVDEHLSIADGREHTFGDTMSLALYMTRYGTPQGSVIFYDENGVHAIINEPITRGQREIGKCQFRYSSDFKGWNEILGKAISHHDLRAMMVPLQHTVRTPEFLQALGSIKYVENVKHDTEIKEIDGEASYGVMFTVAGQGESLKEIPRTLRIAVPILDEDVIDRQAVVTVECTVALDMPKRPGDPLRLVIQCQELEIMRRERLRTAMNSLRDVLGATGSGIPGESWLIVAGRPEYKATVSGAKLRFEGYQVALRD